MNYIKSSMFSWFIVFSDIYFLIIGKQDYKKSKNVLKATRLKAEAKKNFSGFRVRSPHSGLLQSVCFGPSVILLFCLPNLFLFCPLVSRTACLKVSLSRFFYRRHFSALLWERTVGLMGPKWFSENWPIVTWGGPQTQKHWKLQNKLWCCAYNPAVCCLQKRMHDFVLIVKKR